MSSSTVTAWLGALALLVGGLGGIGGIVAWRSQKSTESDTYSRAAANILEAGGGLVDRLEKRLDAQDREIADLKRYVQELISALEKDGLPVPTHRPAPSHP